MGISGITRCHNLLEYDVMQYCLINSENMLMRAILRGVTKQTAMCDSKERGKSDDGIRIDSS